MNFTEFNDTSYKFRSAHRDDYYERLEKDDLAGIFFRSRMYSFMIGFAIGFHLDQRKSVNADGKAINHTNLVNFPDEARKVIVVLMLHRFPNIESETELWGIVEEYAEYGICIAYDSIFKEDNGEIIIDNILGRNLD